MKPIRTYRENVHGQVVDVKVYPAPGGEGYDRDADEERRSKLLTKSGLRRRRRTRGKQ